MTELKHDTEKEGFATRWSRRKQQNKLEQEARQDINIVPAEQSEAEIAARAEQDREQLRAEKLAQLNALSDADMPDIATLNDDSDFSQFMSTNVSEALRKLALRKLFQGAGYNVRDGLDEYDGDYTHFEKLDPSTITADMKYRLELKAEKLRAQIEAEEAALLQTPSDEDVKPQEQCDECQDEQTGIEEKRMENKSSENADHEQQTLDEEDDARQADAPGFSQQPESGLNTNITRKIEREENP